MRKATGLAGVSDSGKKKKKDLGSQKHIVFKTKCNLWPDRGLLGGAVCDPKDGGNDYFSFYFKEIKFIVILKVIMLLQEVEGLWKRRKINHL